MGQCLEVYSVSRAALNQLINSGNDAARRQISGRSRRGIEKISEWYKWSTARGEQTVFEAIRHLVMDDERTLDEHLMYHQAYKFIVEPNATSLSNNEFCPFRGDYLGDINTELKEAGCTLDMYKLAWGGAPAEFRIPTRYEDVGTGHWDEASIASNLPILNQNEELSAPLLAIRDWLTNAHGHQNILVGFHTI